MFTINHNQNIKSQIVYLLMHGTFLLRRTAVVHFVSLESLSKKLSYWQQRIRSACTNVQCDQNLCCPQILLRSCFFSWGSLYMYMIYNMWIRIYIYCWMSTLSDQIAIIYTNLEHREAVNMYHSLLCPLRPRWSPVWFISVTVELIFCVIK